MAEMAVSFAIDQLLPLMTKEYNLFKGIHKGFADIKDELESIQAFLKDADRRAATTVEGDKNSEGVKTWVKQVRVAASRIEDIIDAYLIQVEEEPRKHGCISILYKIAHLLKTLIPSHQIASQIQDLKSSLCEIKERSDRYAFQPSTEQSRNAIWHNLRVAPLYNDEVDNIGFEVPRKTLVGWMVNGREERIVVSVVGMGGQGKTTLAKTFFDSKDVMGHFDCRVWITVSQSYDVEVLLRDMLLKFYKHKGEKPPNDLFQMDRESLTEELRNYLQKIRYVVVFDDVWSVHFWDDIEFSLIDKKNGSKILITTRNLDVAMSFKRSSFIEVLELQPLTQEQSLELFYKKAFTIDCGGHCPKKLIGITNDIVKKCKGLPLAIVAIGGLLSTREKNEFKWHSFSENLSLELKKDTNLIRIKEILGLSYDDLPYYLKSCLLYFGLYPEDYKVKSKRVILQWIAEGFVKEEMGKTLEEVAEEYLTKLIHRSLVQVYKVRIDGKVKSCCIHDLIREMILEKIEDLNFCKHTNGEGWSSLSGTIRHISVTITRFDSTPPRIESSHVRSLVVFTKVEFEAALVLPYFRLLKVLDYGFAFLSKSPIELGSLIHLKYLSLRLEGSHKLPNSIGMLENLETLDLRYSIPMELPKEISKLGKLRHLRGDALSITQLKDGIGKIRSLQTLSTVKVDMDDAEVLKELGNLKQMRDLGLHDVSKHNLSILSTAINGMQHLEKVFISFIDADDDEVIDLHLISSPTKLQKVTVVGKFRKVLKLIPNIQNLVVLRLKDFHFIEDPVQSLKSMEHLLVLSISIFSYEGLCFHFQDGSFQKLLELKVESSDELREIIIDKGALPSLKKLKLRLLQQLKNIPSGIQHLEKLEFLELYKLPNELVQHISPEHWIMKQVPFVNIRKSRNFFEFSRATLF